MGIAERREREKEALRTRIVEAARDILSEQGLDALSMRAIAERIEYSPATIYLYFRDKEALVGEIVEEGFGRLVRYFREELDVAGEGAPADVQYSAIGRAYARFAIENTAYFRVMFELPTVPQLDCAEGVGAEAPGAALTGERAWGSVVETVRRGVEQGCFQIPDAGRGALVGWALIHGLTSLYLSGHLSREVASHGDFLDLVEEAMAMLRSGWSPRERQVA